jgi:D-alanyl-D-alanine carboxypeptidase/D-alanyl-D-alanine-endopeptidase (penicillin-binding protein 4)
VREINTFSNNVMAQQVFLTLDLARSGTGTPDGARAVMRQWVLERLGSEAADAMVVDNGSGLSREGRTTADALARLLQSAWASPFMPDLMGSLPQSGVDGTLRRAKSLLGKAHLKTGSLRDVNGVAGYVLGDDGRRHVVVAIVNHPQAGAARPVLEAIVQWAAANDAGRNTSVPRPAQPQPVR